MKTDTISDPFPIRTFNMAAGAGFHDSRFGAVPYTWSVEPYDQISVWQLSPLVERLPQESGTPPVVWSAEGPVLIQEADRLVFASSASSTGAQRAFPRRSSWFENPTVPCGGEISASFHSGSGSNRKANRRC